MPLRKIKTTVDLIFILLSPLLMLLFLLLILTSLHLMILLLVLLLLLIFLLQLLLQLLLPQTSDGSTVHTEKDSFDDGLEGWSLPDTSWTRSLGFGNLCLQSLSPISVSNLLLQSLSVSVSPQGDSYFSLFVPLVIKCFILSAKIIAS